MIVCTKCKTSKEASEFIRDATRKTGRHPWCASCQAETKARHYQRTAEAQKEYRKTYYRNNRAAALRASRHQRLNNPRHLRYGLTTDEFLMLNDAQLGKCAGCGTEFGGSVRRCVDHDHKTGKVRGLLCHTCNLAVGNAKDSPTTLRRLADYLEGHS